MSSDSNQSDPEGSLEHSGLEGQVPQEVAVWRGGELSTEADKLACETPVAMIYNGISHAVMLATPADLTEFAFGFSLTEEIIDTPADIYDVSIEQTTEGWLVNIDIASRLFERLKQRRRQIAGRSGCGLCGVDSLAAVQPSVRPVPPMPIDHMAIQRALAQFDQRQHLNAATGSCHGAAWCSPDGELLAVREDIGRHNAMDKLIGFLLTSERNPGFVLMSSRASFELVQKACAAGISQLVTVSGATSASVDLAKNNGINLIGFARSGRHVIYASSGGI